MMSGFLSLRRISLFAPLSLIVLSADALAQSHPLTLRMSCAQAQGLVASRGAVVLNTGPATYERFVGGYGYCPVGETPQPAWAPTADAAQCPIGYRCASRNIPARN